MKITDSHTASDPPAMFGARRGARALCIGALAGATVAAMLIAGCGGSASGGSVAHINGSTNAKSSTNSKTKPSALAWARCMRSHGVPNYPDSNSSGYFHFSPSSGINRQSPSFQSASTDCKSLSPAGTPTGAQSSQVTEAGLKFATCMQHNGVDVPDPKTNGSGIIQGGGNADPNSPAFQRARAKCSKFLPGAGG